MIIQCEQCATRFKVADDKVTAQGIRVRCSKCQHVFTARADDGTSVPTGAASRPSGIFAAPSTGSPVSTPPPSARASSNPPSSGSIGVPQASLTDQDPTFDPFSPPPPPQAGASNGAAPTSGAGSFSFEDAPSADGDRSFFGQPNQTIGGFDDDDVPAPPSFDEAPAASQRTPPPPPPESASFGAGDPFASPLNASSEGPFAAQAPLAETAVFSDPFAAPASASAASALPPGGDPFTASASGDPFAAADPFAAGHAAFPPPNAPVTTPPGADPFSTGGAPAFASPDAAAASASGGDPFSGLGVDVDPYEADVEEPPAPPPPPPPAVEAPTPAIAAAKAEVATPQKPSAPRRRLRIPTAVPRAAWAVLQACILVAFLTMSIVWVRGGSLDDIAQGNGLDVVLGRAAALGEAGAPVRVDEVVVARRPVAAASDLVVVSGFVVNTGAADAPGARVTVRFGDVTTEAAWANTGIDGVDLASAMSAESLLALNERLPSTSAGVGAGGRAPFVVLARGVPDGAKADVKVEVATPPAPPPDVVEPAIEREPPTAKGKGRRRGKRSQNDATPDRRRAPTADASR